MHDVLVIGAGFGGLGAALELADAGRDVVLCEALNYPGGCASTFTRGGARYEAGATLFSGFGPGQLMRRWIDHHRLAVEVDWIDPVLELRTPNLTIPVPRDRNALLRFFQELPGAPVERLASWFAFQERIADTLWSLFDEPELLPPFRPTTLIRHIPGYLPLLSLAGRPLVAVLRRFGLDRFEPLRTYLDAVCQITVQVGVEEAEAPFAIAATDYFFRGTGHVHGGVGALAEALCTGIRRRGGEVRLANRVRGIRRMTDGWEVDTRRGVLQARHVVANLLPQALDTLIAGPSIPALARLSRRVQTGWGATMLYLQLDRDADLPHHAHHTQLIADPSLPLRDGNHLLASVSARDEDRAPEGRRTVTVSTHVDMATPLSAERIEAVQERLRQTLRERAPALWDAVVHELTASPRTFERFTRRPGGYVGGIPRRAGLAQYLDLFQGPVAPGLHLVGDTVFPGQSTLATAVGGHRVAARILRALPALETLSRPATPADATRSAPGSSA